MKYDTDITVAEIVEARKQAKRVEKVKDEHILKVRSDFYFETRVIDGKEVQVKVCAPFTPA